LNLYVGALGPDDLQRLIAMLTGEPLNASVGALWFEGIPDGFRAVPADVVNIVKKHLDNPRRARNALKTWIAKEARHADADNRR
jgi:hypothetical protein